MTTNDKFLMPAEWAPHQATWIAWPFSEPDFPGKVNAVQWVYVEIVRLLMAGERVEIVCLNEEIRDLAAEQFERSNIKGNFRFHIKEYDRTWLRDSMPTFVKSSSGPRWVHWKFNAWARFDNFAADAKIPAFVSETTKIPLIPAVRPDNNEPLVMEGGAFDVDGEGTILVTEECLLSEIQERNHGLSREHYEQAFATYLGATKTIWLGASCEGDTTHGHVDDIARFIAPGKIAVAVERNPKDANNAISLENLERLSKARDAQGRSFELIELPYPQHRLDMDGFRLPATYANFYIANKVVLVPTFNDSNDSVAIAILQKHFPGRQVIGVHSVDLVLGEGTLHCLTEQEPL